MKKPLEEKKIKKINEIQKAISDIPNTVPRVMKETFNFKGRKSPEIAEKIIETICDKNSVIIDPFMGSGSFVQAAIGKVKKVYGTELDSYVFDSVKALLDDKLDIHKLNLIFDNVKSEAYTSIMDLYSTHCCGQKNHINTLYFDPANGKDGLYCPQEHREIKDGKNIKLMIRCPICGSKTKKFDDNDYQKLISIKELDASRFPSEKYIANSRINITASTGADKYDRNFTHRNKIALLILQDAINKQKASRERDALELILVSSLSLARIAMYGSSTDILYHILEFGAQEKNVWLLFEDKYKSFCKFKSEYKNKQIGTTNTDVQIYNKDYADFINEHKELKVDVIYTDFPYTDQVPYLERNQLYHIWLQNFYDTKYKLTNEILDKEIVLTNAESRHNKNKIETYYNDINDMFSNFSKITKDNGVVVLTLKLGKAKYLKTYSEILNLARKNGFEYVYLTGLNKNDPTLKKQSSYLKTLVNEMIVVFYKMPESERYWYIGNDNYEFIITKRIYSYIDNANCKGTLANKSKAINLICNDLLSRYQYIATKEDYLKIESIIKNHFRVEDDGYIQIDGRRLYLEIEDDRVLFIRLYDLLPIFIQKLLHKQKKFVLEDIYFELIKELCNGNPQTISQILEDKKHHKQIEDLILNYCEIDGSYYIERKDINKPSTTAVDISCLNGKDFEKLVKRWLEKEGYKDAIIIGGAGDRGVDILAKKQMGKKLERYIFQCKRWVANVGSDPIQRLFAEKSRLSADHAFCVTTSGYTKDGKTASKDHNIGIIDGTELMKKLNRFFPGEYYNGLLKFSK